MQGKNVSVFLKTPLFKFAYVVDGQERELLDNAMRVEGKIATEKNAGIMLKVKLISNFKEVDTEPPFGMIFLPFSKIDFMIFV